VALKKSDLYIHLWESCDELRGGMDASQYKDYVLVLLFLKYVSDRAGAPDSLIEVPEDSSFDAVVGLKNNKDIGEEINKVLARLAAENDLRGVIDVGDFLDCTNFSTHRSAPGQVDRAGFHHSLVKAQTELATVTALTPNAVRHLIPGNHEQRIINWLTDNAPFLMGVTLPNDHGHELLSLENLLGTDGHGWQVAAPYPGGIVWLNHNTRCVHGWVAKGVPGASAAEYLRDEVNTFFGHTPRAQTAHRTVARGAATRTFVAHTPGGLMRIDGAVPSGTTATRINGEPALSRGERWEQGFSVVFYDPDGKTVPLIEHVPIFGTRAVWRGREYTATCDADGNPV
jgi:hypothetical protein